MDPLHKTEIFLSFTTTLYGVACLLKFRFTRANAVVMISLFLVQFFYKGPIDLPGVGGFDLAAISCHTLVAWAYVAAAVAEVVQHRREIRIGAALREVFAAMRK
jgi:hypothetical protein